MHKYSNWDFFSKIYDNIWLFQSFSLTPTRADIIKEISSVITKDRTYTVLDMGCGTGQLIADMQSVFGDYDISYTGVDVSINMIEAAKKKNLPNAKFIISSVDDFSEKDSSFDIIICSHSFPYYPDKSAVIDKFHGLLAKDGHLMMVLGSTNNLWDKIIFSLIKIGTWKGNYLSIKDMNKLFEGKFTVEKLTKVNDQPLNASICFFVCRNK